MTNPPALSRFLSPVRLSLVLTVLLVVSVASTFAGEVVLPDRPVCDFGEVKILTDFETGRLSACKQTGRKSYQLDLKPENTPINSSPWYAFKVLADSPREVTVTLSYGDYKHRYHPKTSTDGLQWTYLDKKAVKVRSKGKRAVIKLKVGAVPLWVAAQEIIDNNTYDTWTTQLKKLPFLEVSELGLSAQGRPIHKVETADTSVEQYLVILGRQHPPEVTGALAMMAFSKRLYAGDALATDFRARYGVLMVPNLNPDGVALGNWRHNTGGKDLNRDWGPFAEPETALMRDELSRFHKEEGARPVVFLDFHSTTKDIFYTQPDSAESTLPEFTSDWLGAIEARIQKKIPNYKLNRSVVHNPGKSVARNYVYNNFGVPSMTFELGDETNRQFIRAYATIAAEELMRLLLEIPES